MTRFSTAFQPCCPELKNVLVEGRYIVIPQAYYKTYADLVFHRITCVGSILYSINASNAIDRLEKIKGYLQVKY
jgi:hypothetical protein